MLATPPPTSAGPPPDLRTSPIVVRLALPMFDGPKTRAHACTADEPGFNRMTELWLAAPLG
jgi:hypothetical protein